VVLVFVVAEDWEDHLTATPVVCLVDDHLTVTEDGEGTWAVLLPEVDFLCFESLDLGTLLYKVVEILPLCEVKREDERG